MEWDRRRQLCRCRVRVRSRSQLHNIWLFQSDCSVNDELGWSVDYHVDCSQQWVKSRRSYHPSVRVGSLSHNHAAEQRAERLHKAILPTEWTKDRSVPTVSQWSVIHWVGYEASSGGRPIHGDGGQPAEQLYTACWTKSSYSVECNLLPIFDLFHGRSLLSIDAILIRHLSALLHVFSSFLFSE